MTSDLDSQRCFLEMICAETETQPGVLVQKLVVLFLQQPTDLIRTTDELDHSDQMVNQLRVVQTAALAVRYGSFICSAGINAVSDQNASTATLLICVQWFLIQ